MRKFSHVFRKHFRENSHLLRKWRKRKMRKRSEISRKHSRISLKLYFVCFDEFLRFVRIFSRKNFSFLLQTLLLTYNFSWSELNFYPIYKGQSTVDVNLHKKRWQHGKQSSNVVLLNLISEILLRYSSKYHIFSSQFECQ